MQDRLTNRHNPEEEKCHMTVLEEIDRENRTIFKLAGCGMALMLAGIFGSAAITIHREEHPSKTENPCASSLLKEASPPAHHFVPGLK